jgi:hypothetical protein
MFKGIKGILRTAWSIISERNDKNSQVALAIGVIVVAALLAALSAFFYGVCSRSGGFANRSSGGLVALLACVGAFSAGGMLGLLFGSPTWGGNASTLPAGSEGNTGDPGRTSQVAVRPNTSLERVAEWLTTMIVGLGLVNLASIKSEATSMSIWLTESITGSPAANGSPGIAIAIGFAFVGFLLVYLWSMRFLPSELRNSYDEWKQRAETAEQINRRMLAEFKDKATFVVPSTKLEQLRTRLAESGVESEVCDDVLGRYRASRKADSEPMEDFGPEETNGFKVSALVKDAGAGKYNVTIRLHSPLPLNASKVFWLLHNSFTPDVMSECPVKENGEAVYDTTVDEPFWVGAIVPVQGQPSVRLGLSLQSAFDVATSS